MTAPAIPDRCRLVLATPQAGEDAAIAAALGSALGGGDVASVIVTAGGRDAEALQALAERLAPITQAAGAALIVEGDTRIAGRVGADGVHLEAAKSDLAEAIAKAAGRIMIGAGGIKTRDDALELGETGPDYVFFGRFGYDNKPEPHHRNLGLARWWAEMVEIPCLLLGGSELASVETAAATGAEFVVLSEAVFGKGVDARAAVARANALLDAGATRAPGSVVDGVA